VKGREISKGEILSEINVPWPEREGTIGIDVWKLITNPQKPGFACFWFDRTFELPAEEAADPEQDELPWRTK
jgi:hypothetical protein